MKEVIRINIEQQEQVENPVEFTHRLSSENGWIYTERMPNDFDNTVYLGKCITDGDKFAAYVDDVIYIFKGHLNSGKY